MKKKATKKTSPVRDVTQDIRSKGHPASNVIYDDVNLLNGMISTLLDAFSEGDQHIYWMFVALHEPVKRLKEAMDYFDKNDYCGPREPEKAQGGKRASAQTLAA